MPARFAGAGALITHAVITGMSQSGKTLFAKNLAAGVLKKGRPVLVFDPIVCGQSGYGLNGWPGGCYVLGDWPRFLGVAWGSRSCFLIIDEAADVVEEDPAGLRKLMRRGRHIGGDGCGGHSVVLIAQRYLLSLDKSARDQCSHVYAFCQSFNDAKSIGLDFNAPRLAEIVPALPKFHYVLADKYGTLLPGIVKPPKRF